MSIIGTSPNQVPLNAYLGKLAYADIAPPSLLGIGVADSTSFLRGDGTWQVIPITESDTLASVTGRGSSTSSAISITNTTSSVSSSTGAFTVSGRRRCHW